MNLSLITRAAFAAAIALGVSACTVTDGARTDADNGSSVENDSHKSSGGGEAATKPARRTFDARHSITIKVPEGAKQIKAWFAVPQFDDAAQNVSNFVVRAPWATNLVRDGAGNMFLYLEKDNPGTSEFNVTTEFTIWLAYSWLSFSSTVLAAFSAAASFFQRAICSTQRTGYSSSGIPKRSIRSGRSRLMNHGVYSAKCSEDSVTK